MDFTWVTTDDANAIQNSIVDAKGDLISATANDTPARLAVGANGETLVADSSTSTGLRYTGGTSTGNPIINSAADIWQRGTSFALSSGVITYTADRWTGLRQATGMTVSRQSAGLTGFNYAVRFQRDSGNTATNGILGAYTLESVDSIPYAGKTVTVSFYIRAGANYSATSNAFVMYANWGTGTDQRLLAGFTGSTNFIYTSTTLTTSWQRVTATGTIGSTATQFGIGFDYTPTGTAGANDYYDITGLQVDVGSVALPYRRYSATIQGELSACQRYYYRAGGDQVYQYLGFGVGTSATNVNLLYQFPVTMRVSPTSVDFANLGWYTGGGVTAISNVAIPSGYQGRNAAHLNCTSTGLTGVAIASVLTNNSTSGYLGVSAEL
jgi:hypothetical protein